MYARVVQLTAKSGQGKELSKIMKERTLPMLKQQPGFVDALGLSSDTEPNQFIGISIWKRKEDADKYGSGQARLVLESIKPLLDAEPTFRTFNVEASATLGGGVGLAASSS
jgi:quinol monooxygenase YgiN